MNAQAEATSRPHGRAPGSVVLSAESVTAGYRRHQILHDVSLDLVQGRTVGLVGESGSGKSTLARVFTGLLRPSAGRVLLDGDDLAGLKGRRLQNVRRRVQLIPQDPYASLDPRMTVGATIAEAIDPRRGSSRRHQAQVASWLETVALDASAARRYPHEFSGGQRQRIAIARALAVEPEVIVADEVTSALDSSVQAEVLNLLAGLRVRLGLTMLFISHDLAVIRHVSDEVAVMYLGRIIERAPVDQLFHEPRHPYTRLLLDSVPEGGVIHRPELTAEPPDPGDPPSGCAFHPRCPIGPMARAERDECLHELPVGREVACHHPLLASKKGQPHV
jgi:oligopeptide/dipeptide ABC transporter ATP-binding protein